MQLLEYEQAIIAAILKEPGTIRRIALQLNDDRFSEGITRHIYNAILNVYGDGKEIDYLSVSAKIDLEIHPGGDEYLKQLLTILPRLGIFDLRGLDDWVRIVDNAGRLRQAGLVIKEYALMYDDFKALVNQVSDPDEFLGELTNKLKFAQANTKGGYESFKVAADEFRYRLQENFAGRITDRIPIGWPKLDGLLAGGIPKELIIVCGLPSMGKSQFALQLAVEISRSVGYGCVAVNSLEMKRWRIIQRLACAYGEVDYRDISSGRAGANSPQARRLLEQIQALEHLPIYIDESDLVTSSVIDFQASALNAQYGPINALIIDYAELMKEGESSQSEELRVSNVYRRAQSLSKQLDIPVFLLSQYNRGVTSRNDKLGTNFDIRYSGAAEAAAYTILHIYNPYQLKLMHVEVTPPSDMPYVVEQAYIVVGKDKDAGTGFCSLGWKPQYTKWFDNSEGFILGGRKAVEDEF